MPQIKRWKTKPLPDSTEVMDLAKSLNVNQYLATILVQRGIQNFDQAKAFFRPDISELHDPFLMKDMQKAIDRIVYAIENKEKILIYGDYDVDGTTSVALVYDFLTNYHPFLDFYIPDRHIEGYGISYQGINYADQNGISLIIALDCGIKAVDQVQYAREKGIDFIICDHHNPGETVPSAIACLDPKQLDCQYPYKELSGCGVGFKLMQAFCLQHDINQEQLIEYLDLVAISIGSDIVPITGENRILTYFGLQKINQRKRPGIKALIDIAGFKKDLTVTNVVFGLGPRINAAGRIKHGKASVELLISKTDQEAQENALELNKRNLTRRDLDSGTLLEAIALIEDNEESVSAKSTVLFKNDWHKGVIGIVASKCIEQYYRPTVILTESNEKATGSARTVEGFDLYEAICECSDLLEQFGGHTHAAGLTLKLENIPAFKARFEEVVTKRILPDQLIPVVNIDIELPLDAITEKFNNVLSQMEPFGPQNMSPVFKCANVLPLNARLMKDEHLKFSLKQTNGNEIDVIGFGMSHCYDSVLNNQPVDICFSVEMNEFNNKKSLQLLLKDLRCTKDFL
ncbi:MAG: single-stranded-DNA-specific exonuclease RecJ [Opitutaceae bacterium]|nr:single-stranded-DNA-specific exonuclease RecJ [Cytophagales bacterium]